MSDHNGLLRPWTGPRGRGRAGLAALLGDRGRGDPGGFGVQVAAAGDGGPELVVEVAYDYMEGERFRHTGQFRRWRPDRDPKTCTYEQLERPLSYAIQDIWGE